MPKKQLTEEEVKSMVDLSVAAKAAEVAEAVFQKKFEDIQKEVDGFSGKMNNIIYGVMVASFFLFISLIVGVWIFMASMKQSYFQTQDGVNNKINELIQNNTDLKTEIQREQDSLGEKQDYIERLLLER